MHYKLHFSFSAVSYSFRKLRHSLKSTVGDSAYTAIMTWSMQRLTTNTFWCDHWRLSLSKFTSAYALLLIYQYSIWIDVRVHVLVWMLCEFVCVCVHACMHINVFTSFSYRFIVSIFHRGKVLTHAVTVLLQKLFAGRIFVRCVPPVPQNINPFAQN